MDFLTTTGAFIVVLGVIIFVHEFGHFITAKAFGMRVFVFSFGFGRRLLGFKWGDTDCRLSLVPLGGYVKLEGEADDHVSEDTSRLGDGRDFTARPRWQRFVVYLAGPLTNVVLTVGVLTALFVSGSGEVDATPSSPAVIGRVEAGSPAATAGLVPGDEIRSIDGQPIATWEDAFTAIAIRPDTTISLGIRRSGAEHALSLRSISRGKERVGYFGVGPPVLVKPVAPDSPAAQAGIRGGDALLSIDGRPVQRYDDLLNAVFGSEGRTLRFRLRRGTETIELSVTPRRTSEGFRIGLGPHTILKRFGLGGAFVEACRTTWQQTKLTFEVLKRLLTAQLSVKSMMGPLGIAGASGEAARSGWAPFFTLVAVISLQIGLLNLFPLPPLDGGHLAILASESALRRDLSLRVKVWIMNTGAAVLFLLIGLVLYSDLSKTSWLGKYLP